ncbi:MAG: 3-oxoacyl-ACP synthase III family protein, partial [Candidatus Methylumidiphilus sp.]
GCASFVSGLIYASAMIRSGFFQNILLISVSNFAGRVQGRLKERSAVIPGDGAAAFLIRSRENGPDGLLGWWEKSFGEHYGHFGVHSFDRQGERVDLWGPHDRIRFSFHSEMVDSIKANSRELIPLALQEALSKCGRRIGEIDLVLTHQPNRYLIDHWRQSVGASEEKSHDTLERYGNLFQASIPVTLEDAINQGKLKSGDTIAMASFAFAGELASSAVIQWD